MKIGDTVFMASVFVRVHEIYSIYQLLLGGVLKMKGFPNLFIRQVSLQKSEEDLKSVFHR